MYLFEEWRIDWTAVAAVTALMIWAGDMWRRYRQGLATERFLAQIIVTEFAAAHIEIAKLRSFIVSPGGSDMSGITSLLDSQEARQALAEMANQICLEMPSAVLDKADVFRQWTSNRMAWAMSNVRRLKQAGMLMADLQGPASPDNDIQATVLHFLELIKATEQAIQEAYTALLEAGKASRFMTS